MEKVSKEHLRDVLKQVMEDKLQETLGYTSTFPAGTLGLTLSPVGI